MNIDGELEDTKGVQSANTNYAKSVSEVVYDPDEVKTQDITAIIKKLGYDSTETN